MLPVKPRIVAAESQVPTNVKNRRKTPIFRSPTKNLSRESLAREVAFPTTSKNTE